MNAEKSIVIVTAMPNPDETEAMAAYAEKAHALLAKTESKGISLYNIKEKIHGEDAGMVYVAEFPSDESVKGFFNGAEYLSLMPQRDKAFKSFNVYIVTPGEL